MTIAQGGTLTGEVTGNPVVYTVTVQTDGKGQRVSVCNHRRGGNYRHPHRQTRQAAIASRAGRSSREM